MFLQRTELMRHWFVERPNRVVRQIFLQVAMRMGSGLGMPPNASAAQTSAPRLSSKVVGACLRSAFIEALYEDCSDMVPSDPTLQTDRSSLPLAAE